MINNEPYKSTEYTFEQSKYDIAARLPMRSLIVGPSGTGKSVHEVKEITNNNNQFFYAVSDYPRPLMRHEILKV